MDRKDVLTNGDDLTVNEVTGDLFSGKSDQQHIEHIMIFGKGDIKEVPLLGVNADRFLKGVSKQRIKRDAIDQIQSDNYGQVRVAIFDGEFSIDATPRL